MIDAWNLMSFFIYTTKKIRGKKNFFYTHIQISNEKKKDTRNYTCKK